MDIMQDELYPAIKCVNLFPLTSVEQVSLIDAFHECYFDTDVAVKDFAIEFQRVVSHILAHYVPITLEQLIEFQPIIADRLMYSTKGQSYKEAIKGEN